MAAHKLPRLSKSILDRPQLITPEKFKEIAEVLENRSAYMETYKESMFFDNEEEDGDGEENLVDESVGILNVEGATTYKKTGWEALCGGTSYVGLLEQMKQFVSEGKKTVLMKLDSGGGQAYRMIHTARTLRQLADENDIHLIGYVDGTAASAGYGLLASCHEVIANPESEVGSIGVVISLLDTSEAMKEAGVKRVFITAGGEKVPFAEDGSFRETFLESLQEDVDTLYEKFTNHVADMRNIDLSVVKGTEAKMFSAEQALTLGLIDKEMEEPEFYNYLAERLSKNESGSVHTETETPKTKEVNLMSDTEQMDASTELANKVAEMQKMLDTQAAQLTTYQSRDFEAKKANLSTKLDSSAYLSESKEQLMSFFLSEETTEANASLMDKVIASADAALTSQKEASATLLAETKELSDKALKEATNAKEVAELNAKADREAFGEKEQVCDETVPEAEAIGSEAAQLAANVEKYKTK